MDKSKIVVVSNTYKHRVRYADTDKMGIVYNGNYLTYFEIGRTELIRSIGLPYSQVEQNGYQLPLIDASLKFINPARYDDLIEIGANCEFDRSKLKIVFQYEITIDSMIICTGQTTHVFIRSSNNKPTRAPEFFKNALSAINE